MNSGDGQLFDAELEKLRVATFQDELDFIVYTQAQADALQPRQRLDINLGPDFVQRGFRKVALRDGDDLARTGSLESQLPLVIEMELDVVAVVERLGRGDDGAHGNILQTADALELVAQDLSLGRKLKLVRHVLVMATATNGEMRAAGSDSLRGRLQDFDQLRTDVAALFFHDPDTHLFAGQNEGQEGSPTIGQASEGIAAVNEGNGRKEEFWVFYFMNSSMDASRFSRSFIWISPMWAMRKVLPLS